MLHSSSGAWRSLVQVVALRAGQLCPAVGSHPQLLSGPRTRLPGAMWHWANGSSAPCSFAQTMPSLQLLSGEGLWLGPFCISLARRRHGKECGPQRGTQWGRERWRVGLLWLCKQPGCICLRWLLTLSLPSALGKGQPSLAWNQVFSHSDQSYASITSMPPHGMPSGLQGCEWPMVWTSRDHLPGASSLQWGELADPHP